MTLNELLALATTIKNTDTPDENTALRIGSTLESLIKSRDTLNITYCIPKLIGYYAIAEARAAVPEVFRKLGLEITYMTSAKAWRKEMFIGNSVGDWSEDASWMLGEQNVQESEATRVSNEGDRQEAESARAEAEGIRANAEDVRIDTETQRANDENERKENETTRGNNETTRGNNEGNRIQNENVRLGAESTRGNNEGTRVNQEAARVIAENARNISSNVYNVTVQVPLTAGQYYTAGTAREAVPVGVKKLGLEITYATSAGVWVSERFTGASTSTWTTDANWKLLANSDDLYFTSNAIGAKFIKELYVSGSIIAGKVYYIGGVGRNATTYHWFIYISEMDANGSNSRIVAYLQYQLTEPTGTITIPAFGGSGISAQILIDWTVIADGANITPGWVLNQRAFNLTKSPTLYSAYIDALNTILFNTKVDKSTYANDFSKGIQIAYQHPRGDGEFVGNDTYSQNALGCWFKPSAYSFNRIQIKAAVNTTGLVNIKIYKGDKPNANSTFNISSLTLLYETSQTWDNDSTKTRTIDTTTILTVESDKYIYILYSTLSSNIVISRTWNTNPNSDRNFILFKVSTDYVNHFSGIWSTASNPTFGQVDPIASLRPPFVYLTDYDALLLSLANTISATNGRAELKADSFEYIHERGLAEHYGNTNYNFNIGVAQHQLIDRNMYVKRLSASIYAPTFTGTIEIRVGTTFNANPATHTLVESIAYNSSKVSISNSSDVLSEIELTNWLNLKAGNYLYIYFIGNTGESPRLMVFNAQSAAPLRPTQFIFNNAGWMLANVGYKYCAPILLKNDIIPYSDINKLVTNALTSQLALKANSLNPRITIPAKIYAVVGTELNLFYDALILGTDCGIRSPKEYSVEIICSKGVLKERNYKLLAVSGDVGNYSMVINVYDYNHAIVATKAVTLYILPATAPALDAEPVVMIGDSLMSSNDITITTRNNFVALGSNTPAFKGFLGTAPNNHQGIGGWTFAIYAGAGPSYYKFTVSGVTSIASGATYSNNGSQFYIREVNINGGVGYIKGERSSGTNAPSASGTLTKVSGSGDASVTFSSVVLEAGNPLWNPSTSALDIAYYRTNLGMGATKFKVVVLQLGINESFGVLVSDANRTAIINSAKAICAAFLADNSGTKIIVQLPSTDGNTKGGWGANYGSTGYKAEYQMNIWRLREMIISNFDNSVYSANVEVGIAGLVIDRYYGFGRTTQAISARVSTTEEVHINAVHPITEGYQQMGDATYAQILHLIQ